MTAGTVCHYDKKGKFGFIKSPDNPQTIFFHNSQQRSFYCDLDNRIYHNGDSVGEPQIGDEVIVISIETMTKGPKARLWAKAETKRQAEELQSMMYTYRLRLREGYEPSNRFDPKPKYKTVWEGKNLLELRQKTFGIKTEGGGQFSYFFEYLTVAEDGTEQWEHCGDPRF
jgi:hypothetical protein